MYCLANTCYVCLQKDKPMSNINSSLSADNDIIHIIGHLSFDLAWMKTKQIILICEICCLCLREIYKFRAMCLKNSAVMQCYMDKLNSASLSGTNNEAVLRVDMNINSNIKREINLEEKEICIIEETEDNNRTESSDNESDVNRNTYTNDTDTDSASSEVQVQVLQVQVQVHTAIKEELNTPAKKSHKCLTCSKSFNTKSSLQTHTRVHTGEKPYKCARCEKCFSQRSNLVSHMRIHSAEKPYKCAICEKCFCKRSNLVSHIRVHIGDRPYRCTSCKKCFTVKSSLVRHIRRIHTDKNDQRGNTLDQ